MKDLYKRIDEKYENMSGLFVLVPSTKHQTPGYGKWTSFLPPNVKTMI